MPILLTLYYMGLCCIHWFDHRNDMFLLFQNLNKFNNDLVHKKVEDV